MDHNVAITSINSIDDLLNVEFPVPQYNLPKFEEPADLRYARDRVYVLDRPMDW